MNTNLRLERRAFLGATGALGVACAQGTDAGHMNAPSTSVVATSAPPSPTDPVELSERLNQLETQVGGRLGVYAFQPGSARVLAHREHERFAMCSTFKWALAAAILKLVDDAALSLEQMIEFGDSDLLDYAPATRKQVGAGKMTVAELAQAAVTLSDNTAANLLLVQLGGPPALTAFFRTLGDDVTRLDRNEPMLNTNLPGDPRDTTTANAMARSLKAALIGETLSSTSRQQLCSWLMETQTGRTRLRAGFPPGLKAGDKTGTGEHGANNDVAVLWPASGAPIFVASYLSENTTTVEDANHIHAQIGRLVAQLL